MKLTTKTEKKFYFELSEDELAVFLDLLVSDSYCTQARNLRDSLISNIRGVF
jgi:hypothetical protein